MLFCYKSEIPEGFMSTTNFIGKLIEKKNILWIRIIL